MKTLVTAFAALALLYSIATPAYAIGWPNVIRRDVRKEVRSEVKEAKEEVKGVNTTPGALNAFLQGRAAISSGKITAIAGTTLTVEKDGKSYTVLTDDKTQIRRRFWGKGILSEFQVGHTVNVIGLWTDEAKTTIQARLVRDVSIQKRHGVFFGKVLSVTANGWTMATISEKRADQIVAVTAATKFINRKGEPMTQADVQVGHRVRVRGLWDRTSNTVTEVTEAKDFTVPVVNAAPASTPTPTP